MEGACLISARSRTYTLMNGVCVCVQHCVCRVLFIDRPSFLPLPCTAPP